MKIEVFDPGMCCPTGVCGPNVDPALARIAADLKWLESQGIVVERFNLSQTPGPFVAREVVRSSLQAEGSDCLPLVLLDGTIMRRGSYPTRTELAEWVGLKPSARRS